MINFGVTERKSQEFEWRMYKWGVLEDDIEEKFVRSSGGAEPKTLSQAEEKRWSELNIDSRGGFGYIESGWYIFVPPGGTLLLRRLLLMGQIVAFGQNVQTQL